MRSIGIAYGAAIAGMIANAAGLTGGTDPETVEFALSWVFALGALEVTLGGIGPQACGRAVTLRSDVPNADDVATAPLKK